MCGIVGLVTSSPRDAVDSIILPLQQLEYRGYDSCGVAFIDDEDGAHVAKTVGDVDKLKIKFLTDETDRREGLDAIKPKIAIAHTRWATHGAVTLENTHPHVSNDRIYVVHNGVVDNYEELKIKLTKQGYSFTSETDTEVIAHLIYAFIKLGYDLVTSVSAALRDLRGKFSFVVIDSAEKNLVAARKGRPLIVYTNTNDTYVASDVSAFEGMPPGKICFMPDNAVVEARTGGFLKFYRDDNEYYQHLEAYQPEVNTSSAKLRTIMEAEIRQQPTAIASTLEPINIDALRREIAGLIVESSPRVTLVGCGTSYNAAQLGAIWLKTLANVDAHAEISSEFNTTFAKAGLYVLISQSGETADTLAALDKIEQLSAKTLSICNVAHSELVRRTHLHLPTKAGVERSVASTKAFTAQLAALLKLTMATASQLQSGAGTIPFIISDLDRSLIDLPKLVEETIQNWDASVIAAHDLSCAFFLGRGVYLPIAHEGSLKLNEIAYVPSLAYAAGELKYGPLALITEGTPVFTCFNSREANLEKLFSSLSQVQARGGVNYLITDELGRNAAAAAGINCDRWVKLPTVQRYEVYISPILAAVMLQLIAHEIAIRVNPNVDKPRNLAKSVTVE